MKTKIEIYTKGYMAATLSPDEAVSKIKRQSELKDGQEEASINQLKSWLIENITRPGNYTSIQIGKNSYLVQVKETNVMPVEKKQAR